MLIPEGWKLFRDRGIYRDPRGAEFVSVTTALKANGCMTINTPDSALRWLWRGTEVHKFVADVLRSPVGADHSAAFDRLGNAVGFGYAAAFYRFRREVNFEVIEQNEIKLVERGVMDPFHGFAGQLDFAARIHGYPSVVDIKTGSPYRWHGLQLAGYALGLFGDDPDVRRFGLYLRRDGTYRLKPYEDNELERDVFLSCVAVARWNMKLLRVAA